MGSEVFPFCHSKDRVDSASARQAVCTSDEPKEREGKGRERDGSDTRQGVPCVLIAFGLVCNFRRHFAQSTRNFFVLLSSRIRLGDVLPVGLYCWLRSNGIVGVFNGR